MSYITPDRILPAEIILAPEWWNRHEKIAFDRDFFFHPLKRVEEEQHMEKVLFDRWGKFGIGENRKQVRPEMGAVHLAAGFLLQEMMGCRVNYSEAHPPLVLPEEQDLQPVDTDAVFRSEAFRNVVNLAESLKNRYGFLTGDINWGGILNIALDLRGEKIFTDMMMDSESVVKYFKSIASVIERFTSYIRSETGTTSVSVNRGVRFFREPVLLHSQCSHTMISEEDYENFLLPFDLAWSQNRPYGIHYCGSDPHRMAAAFAKIPHLDYLDVGWGGDVKILRQHLPDTFFSIRLSPVALASQSPGEIRDTITGLVRDSGNPYLTGICCINMDDKVTDDRIDAIFETVEELRKEYIINNLQ